MPTSAALGRHADLVDFPPDLPERRGILPHPVDSKEHAIYARLRTFTLFAAAMLVSAAVGIFVPATWLVEKIALDVQRDGDGLFYTVEEEPRYFTPVAWADAALQPERIDGTRDAPPIEEEHVVAEDGSYYRLEAQRHWGWWSLLPPLVAVLLCWLTKEPVTALLGGIVSGALVLGSYDITGGVLIPSLATSRAAAMVVLYLWLLGGLMGVWSRTGAAQAFAEYATRKFVRGPRTAKLVAWGLGVIFFQGGTVSTVVVGTTVKPIADKERISHEELAYVVDSTASPIASQIPFNAWPVYVQALIFVGGVSFLATEADRVNFFLESVPFCFYAIFAILGTFLLSVEKPPFLGKRMKAAIDRARSTGKLDADDAAPLASRELQGSNVAPGYKAHVSEFFLPLALLIVVAVGSHLALGSPNVHWAFSAALLLAIGMALVKGMSLKDLLVGIQDGMKGVVLGCVILLLAITIGGISQQTGGGLFLVEKLGAAIPYFLLPVMLQLLTMVIAFSTGTSWGTYAIAFPLAMPLAWAIAGSQGLSHPELYMTLCFAAVMDGSVYGDQCSPISDTTVLTSVCTGCDLMDHVRTQIPQASVAAAAAAVCWTGIAYFTA